MDEEVMPLPPCPACGADLGCYVAFIRGQYCWLVECTQCRFNQLAPRLI